MPKVVFGSLESLERLVKFEELRMMAVEKAMQEVHQKSKDAEASKEHLENIMNN
jgi:hypothetical protein